MAEEHLQIKDILTLPDSDLSAMSDAELEARLKHLIPIVRRPNKTEQAKEVYNQLDRLGKLLGL